MVTASTAPRGAACPVSAVSATGSALPRQDQVAVGVDRRRPEAGHDSRGIELLDDAGAFDRGAGRQAVALVKHRLGACRSEEHTSELQSLMRISYAVFCFKKNTQNTRKHIPIH